MPSHSPAIATWPSTPSAADRREQRRRTAGRWHRRGRRWAPASCVLAIAAAHAPTTERGGAAARRRRRSVSPSTSRLAREVTGTVTAAGQAPERRWPAAARPDPRRRQAQAAVRATRPPPTQCSTCAEYIGDRRRRRAATITIALDRSTRRNRRELRLPRAAGVLRRHVRSTGSSTRSTWCRPGDPTGTGSGGPGYTIPDELAGNEHYAPGTVAMANGRRPNTGGSQFFLITGPDGREPRRQPGLHDLREDHRRARRRQADQRLHEDRRRSTTGRRPRPSTSTR